MRQPNKGRNQIENFAGNRRKSILQPMDMDQIVARLRSLSNISFASGPTAQFILGDEKSQIILPQEQGVEVFFPFKIYNVDNISDPANTFRTYQVRSGIIGWRPYSSLNFFSTLAGKFSGNFEAPLLCPFDNWCQGGQDNNDPEYFVEEDFYIKAVPNKGGNVFIDPTADTLIFSTVPDFSDAPPQIVLDDSVAPPAGNFAALWIKIVDDPDVADGQSFAQLWGRMFSPNGDGGRQTAPFPDSDPTIFPIGIISNPSIPPYTPWPQQNSANNYVLIEQLLSGNLVNRYPRDVVVFRGFWVADSLAGQVFYPGDQVADDSSFKTKDVDVGMGLSFTYTPVWVYVASSPSAPGSSPNVDSTDWVEVGSILA